MAEPGEFTRRALASGRIDLTEAEGLSELLMAETEVQRRSALARAGGALRKRLDGWRDELLALAAQADHCSRLAASICDVRASRILRDMADGYSRNARALRPLVSAG